MILRAVSRVLRAFASYLGGIADGSVDPADKRHLADAIAGLQDFVSMDLEHYLEAPRRRKRLRKIAGWLRRVVLILEILVGDELELFESDADFDSK